MHTTHTLSLLAVSTVILLAGCNKAPDTQPEESERMSVSFTDLMKLGKNYNCTFSDVDDAGSRTSGTVYMQGTNMRGSFTVTQADGQTYDSNVLRAGDTTYVWTSQQEQGFKMQLDADDASLFGGAQTQTQDQVGIQENDPVDFACERWSPDASTFIPPTDREFLDFSAMMQGAVGIKADTQDPNDDENAAMESAQCAACNRAPDAASQAQCKAALGC